MAEKFDAGRAEMSQINCVLPFESGFLRGSGEKKRSMRARLTTPVTIRSEKGKSQSHEIDVIHL